MAKVLIRAVEPKTTAGGKSYWRVSMQPGGWASTWSASIGKLLADAVGSEVEVVTSKKGDFTNIDSATAPEPVHSEAAPAFGRDALIIRQVALKCAVELAVASQTTDTGWIFSQAGAFVEWINGAIEPPEPDEVPA